MPEISSRWQDSYLVTGFFVVFAIIPKCGVSFGSWSHQNIIFHNNSIALYSAAHIIIVVISKKNSNNSNNLYNAFENVKFKDFS